MDPSFPGTASPVAKAMEDKRRAPTLFTAYWPGGHRGPAPTSFVCLLPTAYRLPPTAYCLPPTAYRLLPLRSDLRAPPSSRIFLNFRFIFN